MAQNLKTGGLMQIAECYKILNISPGEEWLRVRKSYHSLARQYHPDINPEKANTQPSDTRLKEINQAFEKLETHYKTKADKQEFSLQKREQRLFDILNDYPSVQAAFRSGLDFLKDMDNKIFHLDIQKNIEVSQSIRETGGSLNLRSGRERFEVKIPSGDWNQMSLRIQGKGESSLFSNRRGDLLLNLSVPIEETAKPENSRYSYEMKIPKITGVMTLNSSEGPIKFMLPRNTCDGQSFTLRSGANSKILHILTVRLRP